MPVTLDEVKQIIKQEFPDSDVSGIKEENNRVTGTITSSKFKDLDAGARSRLVTEKVRNKLGYRGMNVGFLLPLAPGDKL